jgi:hypothetical protein
VEGLSRWNPQVEFWIFAKRARSRLTVRPNNAAPTIRGGAMGTDRGVEDKRDEALRLLAEGTQ